MKKYRVADMSWREAAEAFKETDIVILPTGTLHAHGPTPIGIDYTAADRLADEVGKKTGIPVLPAVTFGEDDKMARYPGSIGISPQTLESYYIDICSSLRKNGIAKIVFINGHGGNKECLIRAGRAASESGMLVSILEWWTIGPKVMPELFSSRSAFLEELAIAIAIHGKEAIDIRFSKHKGEWGENPTKKILGEKIVPLMFTNYEYEKGPVTIPLDAWDIDLESDPEIKQEQLAELEILGRKIIARMSDYMADFAREFQKLDAKKITDSLLN